MKILHTADWHLGKLIQGIYMTEDQAYILQQLITDIESERPDVIIIAGDLYDRMIPPTEAVQLLDQFLGDVILKLKIPVIAIAGNHDSPSRLDFGSRIMTEAGLHIAGELTDISKPIIRNDQNGEVHFHLIPYAEPGKVRHILNDDAIRTHDDAMHAITARIRASMDPAARHVAIGHAFVTPTGAAAPNTSDAERPLAIGGAEHVSAQHFASFHYTALGHLHQAHHVGDETIRYAGSPLKYSISEEHHNKGYLIVELDQHGNTQVTHRPLTPRRNMRTVEGYIADIEQHPQSDDYIHVILHDEQTVTEPMARIRAVYPNAMHVARRRQPSANPSEATTIADRSKMDQLTLFQTFYHEMTDTAPTAETEALFITTLQAVNQKEGGHQ
jgi:exonuclease SbcD